MFNKRGVAQNAVMEGVGFLLAALLILGILVKLMFFPTGIDLASSKKSFDNLQENLIRAEKEGTFPLIDYPLSIGKGVWFVGFSKFDEEITDGSKTFIRPLEECQSTSLYSCLCLCKDNCNEVIKCSVFEDFDTIREEPDRSVFLAIEGDNDGNIINLDIKRTITLDDGLYFQEK
ncbi:hypothetical protein CMO88_03510 [Candidatus Woesearchaeota archaeon]|nr:hypothetical protein [Candidatus Woesearchaeota archaeon]|tara:strand:+ start:3326 stop:3850 length:525 start_codon:yes stop_codon:yes gene_type:complete